MRLMLAVALCGMPALVTAQDSAVVERVLAVAPEPDGKAYAVSIALQDGRQLALQLQPADAAKIVEGLSKAARSGSETRQIVSLVQGMSIHADAQGKFVFLQPRTAAGSLQALAIPIGGADRFIELFQQKAAEAKTNAQKKQ